MASRYHTLKQDSLILGCVSQGTPPKQVARLLNLSSVWIVYAAMKRERRKVPRGTNAPNSSNSFTNKDKQT